MAAPSRRLLLTRHGQTEWNAVGRLQGHTDIPLDEVGRQQARALADELVGHALAAVWTSDLSRAFETGAIVARVLGLPEPRVEPALRERRFGIFEGLTREQIEARYPAEWQAWRERTQAPPEGEATADAIARLTGALARIAAHEPGPTLVISHGGVMRLWLNEHLALQLPVVKNGQMFVVEHDGTRFRAG